MAQNPHEYLIEQLQFTGDESVGSSSNKIKLNFNHPCKELIFVCQADKSVDYCSSFVENTVLMRALGAQPFNYTDAIDALPNSIAAFSSLQGLTGTTKDKGNTNFINASGLFQDPGADAVGYTAGTNPNITTNGGASASFPQWGDSSASYGGPFAASTVADSGVSDAGAFVLAQTALNLHCWGTNPIVTCRLQLNGQDRFSEREGGYFDVVQPFQHHTRHPDTGINVYSFALRPEEHQPSGTCNFSRIDNATLSLVLSTNCIGGEETAKVRVYATNYNVLRIMSGMGGLAYSN